MSASTAPQKRSPASGGRTRSPARSRGRTPGALTQVLFAQLKDLEPGTPEHTRVRGALIEANLPLVRYAAARFRSRNEPMEDVVQVGTIGLINAIDRFDPERGRAVPDLRDADRGRRDQTVLPRQRPHGPRTAPAARAVGPGQRRDRGPDDAARPLPDDRRDRRAAEHRRGRGAGLHRGRAARTTPPRWRPPRRATACRACWTGSATRTRRWPASSTATSYGTCWYSCPSASSGSCCCATTAI